VILMINFAGNFKIWGIISLSIIIIGIIFALTVGINLGIDFTGGTMMHIELGQTFEVSQIDELLEVYDIDPDIIHAGQKNTQVIIKTRESLYNTQRVDIFNTIKSEFNLEDSSFLEAEQFGPTIGNELKSKAISSLLFASIGMLMYITFRFQFIYGVAAIIALIHDVLILLAVYAIFRIPVNSPFIAAVLTVVGYSINDTIVIFDRVRENVKYKKKKTYKDVANQSISQTLVRSINTSMTTLLVIGSLYVLGVDSIKEFTFPLMAGVIVGTYSSIFIASPVWAMLKDSTEKYKFMKV